MLAIALPDNEGFSARDTRAHHASPGLRELPSQISRELADDALMALVAQDDPAAFAVLYERHRRAAAALAIQMCARRVIAEEVVQDAFFSFWRGRRHFDGRRGSVRAWVLGIVRNRAIDVLREGVARQPTFDQSHELEELIEAGELTYGEVVHREHAREVRAALAGLPPEQSLVILLAYFGGYTHSEIAVMLRMPVGTVKGRMRLALRKMSHALLASA